MIVFIFIRSELFLCEKLLHTSNFLFPTHSFHSNKPCCPIVYYLFWRILVLEIMWYDLCKEVIGAPKIKLFLSACSCLHVNSCQQNYITKYIRRSFFFFMTNVHSVCHNCIFIYEIIFFSAWLSVSSHS